MTESKPQEILTGKRPYEGKSDLAILRLFLPNRYLEVLPYEPVTDTTITRRLSRIARSCWAWEPEQRPSIKTILEKLSGSKCSSDLRRRPTGPFGSVRELPIPRSRDSCESGSDSVSNLGVYS